MERLTIEIDMDTGINMLRTNGVSVPFNKWKYHNAHGFYSLYMNETLVCNLHKNHTEQFSMNVEDY